MKLHRARPLAAPAVSGTTPELAPAPEGVGLDGIGLDAFAPYLMNRIMGRYNQALRAEMVAMGLTTAKMRALAVLSVRPGLQMRALADYAVVEQSTLSRAVEALADDGLVSCTRDSADSRSVRVELTEAGQAAFTRLWPHMARAYAGMFRGIGPEERQAFVATLRRMLANVSDQDTP